MMTGYRVHSTELYNDDWVTGYTALNFIMVTGYRVRSTESYHDDWVTGYAALNRIMMIELQGMQH